MCIRDRIKTHLISGGERGIGRTPRMKTDAVQSIILAGLDDFFPRLDIHRRITREREIAAGMREPQVDGATVDEQVFVVVGDFAEAECHYTRVINTISFE